MSALFLPVMILLTGFLLPFIGGAGSHASYERVHGLVSFWLVKLVLFAVIAFSLFHCAHRIRHILMDVGLREAAGVLSVICYGAALVGAGIAASFLIGL